VPKIDIPEQTTAEIVKTWRDEIEGIWTQITDDEQLDDDQKAGLIQVFEDIDGLLDDAKKILGESSDGE